jgi:hypothetical protein
VDAPKDVLYTVTEIYPEHVVLDGNHPLAGIALRLHLKVEGVREATEEEIGAGPPAPASSAANRRRPAAPRCDVAHPAAGVAAAARSSRAVDHAVVDAHAVAHAQVAGAPALRTCASPPLSVFIVMR